MINGSCLNRGPSINDVVSKFPLKATSSKEDPPNDVTVGFWCQTIHKKILRRFDTIFGLKMMMKSDLEKIILKFHGGLPANLLGQFSLSWQDFLHWVAATLKRHVFF